MAVNVTASTLTPVGGQSVTLTGGATPAEDITLVVRDPSGALIATYTIYLKSKGIATITVIPSLLGPTTVWHPVGANSGTLGTAFAIAVNATPGTVPSPYAHYNLIVQAAAGGTTDPPPGTYSYAAGTAFYVSSTPDPGMQLAGWWLNMTRQLATPRIQIVITSADQWLMPIWEPITAAPAPAPVTPTTPAPVTPTPPAALAVTAAKATLTVTFKAFPGAIGSTPVLVKIAGQTAALLAPGSVTIANLDPGSYTLNWGAAGGNTFDVPITLAAGQKATETIDPAALVPADPLTTISRFLSSIWDMLLGALGNLTKPLIAGIEGQSKDALAAANEAFSAESPDPEVKAALEKASTQLRQRQEEILRSMYTHSLDISRAPIAAQALVALYMGAQVAVEVAATVADNLQPLRSLRVVEIAQRINDGLGLKELTPHLMTMPVQIGALIPLRYWYNSQFAPLIADSGELLQERRQLTITDVEYTSKMLMHGFSPRESDRVWDAHWRTVDPGSAQTAYQRGIIDEATRDMYLWLAGLRPNVREGWPMSDLELMNHLSKTSLAIRNLSNAWKYGLITDAKLLESVQHKGYEEDSELVTNVLKEIALASDRGAVARAAGLQFQKTLLTEADFRAVLTQMHIVGERADLWIYRYKLARKQGVTTSELALIEGSPLTA